MYWTVGQMIAHHTASGCNLNPGDLLGTGTISAALRSGFGSLLELSEGGRRAVPLPGGKTGTFWKMVMRSSCAPPPRPRTSSDRLWRMPRAHPSRMGLILTDQQPIVGTSLSALSAPIAFS